MARLCTLASGSTGNSTYISTCDGDILIDVGLSFKGLMTAIDAAGGNISKIKAVAVTHTHTDHIKGLKTFLKNTKIPLIASSETLNALALNDFIPVGVKTISAENESVILGDIAVTYFATNHDAAGSGGYVITLPDGRRAAVCTDLGVMTDSVRNSLNGCTTVLIESNHDVEMLKRGPYPANLKLRILSELGHLSNKACAAELPALLKSGTTRIVLGHLSQQNNTAFLAQSAARATLVSIGAKDGDDYILQIAKPKTVGVTVF